MMDPLSLLGRAVAVFLLLGITLWLIRRTDGMKKLRRSETPLEVLGSARLGKGASVALVRIGDADYALGVTDQAVSLLTEAELADAPDAPDADAAKPARPRVPAALQAQLGLLTRRGRGSLLDRAGSPAASGAESVRAGVAAPAEAGGSDGSGDCDFELLLAVATAPAEPVEETVPEAAPAVSSRLKELVKAAEAGVNASADRTLAPVPAPRPTGARGARGPRARAAAGEREAVGPDAVRTGQRRSARDRTAAGRDSAAA